MTGGDPHPGVVARALAAELDRWWDDLGRPDPYVVVEDGAADGRLAAGLPAGAMRCAPALRYLLVEPDAGLRAAQAGRLALEPPAELLGPVLAGVDGDPVPVPGIGPLFASSAELPRGLDLAVVLRVGAAPTGPGPWVAAARRVAADGLAVVVDVTGFPPLGVVARRLGWVDRGG